MSPCKRTVSALGVAAMIAACSSPPPPAPKPLGAPIPPTPAAAAAPPATPAEPKPVAAPSQPGQPGAAQPASAQAQKPGQPTGAIQPANPGQVVAATTPTGQPGSPQAADAIRAAGETMAPPKPLYDVRGRRDPFQNLELVSKEGDAAGRFTVAATKLTGIIQGPTSPLALVETTEGHGYILKPGDTLGDGRVLEIGRDSVVFIVPPRPGTANNKLVLKLTTD